MEKSGELPEIEVLIAAIEQQVGSSQWSKDGGQFIPYPATWLNGAQWENEMEAEQAGQAGPPVCGNLVEDLAAKYGE